MYESQYIAFETEAPPGYYLSTDIHVFDRTSADADHVLRSDIVNEKGGPVLPATGGEGTVIYTVAGGALMLGSSIMLLYGYKKEEEKKKGTK